MSVEKNDWRLQGQEQYMKNLSFVMKQFPLETLDHCHCEFCWEKIGYGNDAITKGYQSTDKYRWVCEACFQDFKDMFNFVVEI